jgi:hypothetical protein
MPLIAVNNENQHEQAGDDRSRPRWSVGTKMDAVLRLLVLDDHWIGLRLADVWTWA